MCKSIFRGSAPEGHCNSFEALLSRATASHSRICTLDTNMHSMTFSLTFRGPLQVCLPGSAFEGLPFEGLHACIHASMHTCMQARMHAYMHTCIHAHMNYNSRSRHASTMLLNVAFPWNL